MSVPRPVINIPKLPPLGRKLLAEFFGTFILVYVICQVNDTTNHLAQGGIAVGFCLVSLIFTLSHHSFAHFNPAVSFAWFLLGFLDITHFVSYVVVQILGGWCGSLVVVSMIGDTNFPVVEPADNSSAAIARMFVVELIATSVLAITVSQVAASKQRANNFFGLAIGTVVISQAYVAGKMSGASFNPAVTSALQLTKCMIHRCDALKYWAVYIAAEMTGGVIAFLFFCLTGSYAEGEGNNYEQDAPEQQQLITSRNLHRESELSSNNQNKQNVEGNYDAADDQA